MLLLPQLRQQRADVKACRRTGMLISLYPSTQFSDNPEASSGHSGTWCCNFVREADGVFATLGEGTSDETGGSGGGSGGGGGG